MDLLSYFMDLSQMICFLAPCFCSELKVLNESKYSMPGVRCAFGNVFYIGYMYFWYFRGYWEWLLGVWEREWIISFPKLGNRKRMEKIHFQISGMGREWKRTFQNIRNGKGMKKSNHIIRERESYTFIPGNGGEREFLLAHVVFLLFSGSEQVDKERSLE